jgi:hypothetical protein
MVCIHRPFLIAVSPSSSNTPPTATAHSGLRPTCLRQVRVLLTVISNGRKQKVFEYIGQTFTSTPYETRAKVTEGNKDVSNQYLMGYNNEIVQMFGRRSAVTHAAYLFPHLRTGISILDIGCGPGSISVGLAKAVKHGKLQGLDIEESQVKEARSAATAEGLENAFFDVGDVTQTSLGVWRHASSSMSGSIRREHLGVSNQ